MPTIIGQSNTTPTVQAPYYKRQIRCPGHWLVSPKVDVYLREPVAELKDCKNFVEFLGKKIKIKKERIAKDKWGNKKIDWKKLYELKRKGTGDVINPTVSASWAIENIWDPQSLLCQQCPKWCREARGQRIERTIKRLNQ